MTKVSILGCGWLGLPLGAELKKKGFEVKGSTTREEKFPLLLSYGISAFQMKASHGGWSGDHLPFFLDCDQLIIAVPPGTKKNPDSTHALEIKMLMDLVEVHGSSIQSVLYISSTSVYKNLNKEIHEHEVQTAEEAANLVLFDAEQHILNSRIPVKTILRLGGLTGYNRMLARFFSGKTDLPLGNEPVNLLHLDDAVAAVLFTLEHNLSGIYNVCSPSHPCRRDFYTRLSARMGLEMPGFPGALDGDWKIISTEKIVKRGFAYQYPDPDAYTYLPYQW